MSKAVGIIPARWASTRFPGKPLHTIAGKPLLQRVWENCRRAKSLDSVIIATDDMRIARAAFDWGAEVAMTSPRHQSGTDRVAEVAKKAKTFAYIVNIQGDEPLIDPRLIDRLVRKLRSNRKIDIVTAAHPFSNRADMASPHQVKVAVDRFGRAVDFSRTAPRNDGFPAVKLDMTAGSRHSLKLLRHQGIYGFRREALLQFVKWKPSSRERAESLEQLRALENGVTVHVLVTKHGSPGVDTPQDAKVVAASLSRGAAIGRHGGRAPWLQRAAVSKAKRRRR
jgi:3-deoxy-manno-octulosonate cytidylyltransferase (CMP-KDO synthetase)